MKILGYDLDVEILDSGLIRYKNPRKRGRKREFNTKEPLVLYKLLLFLQALHEEGYSIRHIDRPVLRTLIQNYLEVTPRYASKLVNFLIALQLYY